MYTCTVRIPVALDKNIFHVKFNGHCVNFGFIWSLYQELIQNAEDAGARDVKFLYDKTTYGTDPKKLCHRDLASFQVHSDDASFSIF